MTVQSSKIASAMGRIEDMAMEEFVDVSESRAAQPVRVDEFVCAEQDFLESADVAKPAVDRKPVVEVPEETAREIPDEAIDREGDGSDFKMEDDDGDTPESSPSEKPDKVKLRPRSKSKSDGTSKSSRTTPSRTKRGAPQKSRDGTEPTKSKDNIARASDPSTKAMKLGALSRSGGRTRVIRDPHLVGEMFAEAKKASFKTPLDGTVIIRKGWLSLLDGGAKCTSGSDRQLEARWTRMEIEARLRDAGSRAAIKQKLMQKFAKSVSDKVGAKFTHLVSNVLRQARSEGMKPSDPGYRMLLDIFGPQLTTRYVQLRKNADARSESSILPRCVLSDLVSFISKRAEVHEHPTKAKAEDGGKREDADSQIVERHRSPTGLRFSQLYPILAGAHSERAPIIQDEDRGSRLNDAWDGSPDDVHANRIVKGGLALVHRA